MSKVTRATTLLCVALSLTWIVSLASAQTNQTVLEKLPYSGDVLMARAIHAGRIQVPTVGPLGFGSLLSCSPAPCALPTSQASPGPSPANETPIVANPSNHQILMSGANDYDCPNVQGFYVSTNAGTTWNHTCMGTGPGLAFGAGDPGVGFNTHGLAFITGLDFTNNNGIDVVYERSGDNGTTWSPAQIAFTALFSGGQSDKDWLQIDTGLTSPFRDCLYISTTQFDASSDSAIAVAHSCDRGHTWTNVQVDTLQTFPGHVDQFSDLAIGKDGTVYVTWLNCPTTGPTGDCGGTNSNIRFSKSTDGGNTWSTPSTVVGVHLVPDSCGAFYGCLPNTSERVSEIPAIDIDNSTGPNAGSLYVVYYNFSHSQMRVFVTHSRDGGATWSAGVNVAPFSAVHDEFFPWLTVTGNGWVGVTWLDRRNDPANVSYQAFAAISQNGGASFGPNEELTTALSNPNNDGFGGTFMGDYTGNFFAGNTLFASWADTSNGSAAEDVVGGFVQ